MLTEEEKLRVEARKQIEAEYKRKESRLEVEDPYEGLRDFWKGLHDIAVTMAPIVTILEDTGRDAFGRTNFLRIFALSFLGLLVIGVGVWFASTRIDDSSAIPVVSRTTPVVQQANSARSESTEELLPTVLPTSVPMPTPTLVPRPPLLRAVIGETWVIEDKVSVMVEPEVSINTFEFALNLVDIIPPGTKVQIRGTRGFFTMWVNVYVLGATGSPIATGWILLEQVKNARRVEN